MRAPSCWKRNVFDKFTTKFMENQKQKRIKCHTSMKFEHEVKTFLPDHFVLERGFSLSCAQLPIACHF